MTDIQEQVEQWRIVFREKWAKPISEEDEELFDGDFNALLRTFLEECCGSFNETFLMNIMNQSPMTQKKMLDDQIRAPFPWLEEK